MQPNKLFVPGSIVVILAKRDKVGISFTYYAKILLEQLLDVRMLILGVERCNPFVRETVTIHVFARDMLRTLYCIDTADVAANFDVVTQK